MHQLCTARTSNVEKAAKQGPSRCLGTAQQPQPHYGALHAIAKHPPAHLPMLQATALTGLLSHTPKELDVLAHVRGALKA